MKNIKYIQKIYYQKKSVIERIKQSGCIPQMHVNKQWRMVTFDDMEMIYFYKTQVLHFY